MVPIMTVHKSKGLEYNTVVFVGLGSLTKRKKSYAKASAEIGLERSGRVANHGCRPQAAGAEMIALDRAFVVLIAECQSPDQKSQEHVRLKKYRSWLGSKTRNKRCYWCARLWD